VALEGSYWLGTPVTNADRVAELGQVLHGGDQTLERTLRSFAALGAGRDGVTGET
jgi:hypothetical protein